MNAIKQQQTEMSVVTTRVTEIRHREKTLVFTEHTWNNGGYDATLRNGDGTTVNDNELFVMAQRVAKNAAKDGIPA